MELKKKIRFFVSSPGDVFQERLIAKRVIFGLARGMWRWQPFFGRASRTCSYMGPAIRANRP